jgi:hypothetical protein
MMGVMIAGDGDDGDDGFIYLPAMSDYVVGGVSSDMSNVSVVNKAS